MIEPSPAAEAFQTVMAHEFMLKAAIAAVIHDPDLANETFSDVRLALVQCWDEYDPARPFAAWAFTVARHLALKNLRRHTRDRSLLADDVLQETLVEIAAIADPPVMEEYKEVLPTCLDDLPDRLSHLVRLRYLQDYSYPEISGMVGTSIRTLYVTLARARTQLSICLRSKVTL